MYKDYTSTYENYRHRTNGQKEEDRKKTNTDDRSIGRERDKETI